MAVRHVNTLDKIVKTYMSAITRETIFYDNALIFPKPLQLSPQLFRHYTCPPDCGACCSRFSLVYIPSDPRPLDPRIKLEYAYINGKRYNVLVDRQDDSDAHHCRHLNMTNGRCGIHGQHPFSCDFELLRVTQTDEKNILSQRLYARGWNMLQIDLQTRGAQCEMIPQTASQLDDMLRRLRRLKQWVEYFELSTHIDAVIAWCETGPHDTRIIINPDGSTE